MIFFANHSLVMKEIIEAKKGAKALVERDERHFKRKLIVDQTSKAHNYLERLIFLKAGLHKKAYCFSIGDIQYGKSKK